LKRWRTKLLGLPCAGPFRGELGRTPAKVADRWRGKGYSPLLSKTGGLEREELGNYWEFCT